jgi:ABC-type uncharacterized transport system permease subunit
MNETVAINILASGMALTVPILWAALGDVINQKAGIINIGIEGVMLVAAFGAAAGVLATGNPALGLVCGIAAALLAGVALSYLYMNRGADQIVTGILFNLGMIGLTTVLLTAFMASTLSQPTFGPVAIPLLSGLPIVGPSLFSQPIVAYAAFLVAPVVYYVLRHTPFGLYVRAIGERPAAAEAAGIGVWRLRWMALLLGCALVGVGGSCLVLTITGNFVPQMSGGRGFIAVAVVMLSRWNPLAIVLGSALFGVATALQFQLQLVPELTQVPSQVWLALPYVVAIVAISASKSSRFPTALGIPYRRGGWS